MHVSPIDAGDNMLCAIVVGIAIKGCGCTLPAADDIRVLGGISVTILVGVLVTFLYIIWIPNIVITLKGGIYSDHGIWL